MPCFDGRDNERQVAVDYEDRERLREEWTHNSPVAELLCSVLHALSLTGQAHGLLHRDPKLAKWWRDHQARDRRKGKRK